MTKAASLVPTIDELLFLRGAKRGTRTRNKARAHQRAPQSKFLAENFGAFDQLRQHLFHPYHHDTVTSERAVQKVADYLRQQGWIEQLAGHAWRIIDNKDEDTRGYLAGGWLEEYVFLAHEAAGADEVVFGQEVEWKVNGTEGRNEIDVLARRGTVLSFTSCKAIRAAKSSGHMEQLRSFVTETDYWNIHFSADAGRALLVTTADFVDEHNGSSHRYPQLLARSHVLDVAIVGVEDLHWSRLVQMVDQHWRSHR